MGKIVKEWSKGSVSVAVEAGKDDANGEDVHVHVYKRGRRTEARVPGKCTSLDRQDADLAEDLFYDNYSEISYYYDKVKSGFYDG